MGNLKPCNIVKTGQSLPIFEGVFVTGNSQARFRALAIRVPDDIAWLQLLDGAAAVGPLGIAFGLIANFVNGELWGRPATLPWAVIFPQAPLINGINVPRHPSQLYGCAMEGLLVFCIAQWVCPESRIPGTTTAAECISYGIGRFIDEFWRQPDLGQPTESGNIPFVVSSTSPDPLSFDLSPRPANANSEPP